MQDAQDTAGIGHNKAPIYDETVFADLDKRLRELADAGGEWLAKGQVSTEEEAQNLNDAIAQVKKHAKAIEDARKAAKQPHLDAGKEVDTAFGRLSEPAKKLTDGLVNILTAYATKKRKAEEAAKREAQRKADEEAAAAAKAKAEAEARNDVMGMAAAEEAEKEAAKAAKEAAKPAKTQVSSATGGAKTANLRTVGYTAAFKDEASREVERVRLLNALCKSRNYAEKIDEYLLTAAVAAKRAQGGPDELPGVNFTPIQKAI